MVTEKAVHRLLIECGFRNVLWPAPLGQHWGVVGELPGDVRIVITCMPIGGQRDGKNRFRLHVAPAAAREWLKELLAQHGAPEVVVTTDPVDQHLSKPDSPWLYLGLGAGAIALFSYVISTIAATGALHR
jgi:hypothetical protein